MKVIQSSQRAVFRNPYCMQLISVISLKCAEFFQNSTINTDVGMSQVQYVQKDSNVVTEVNLPHTLSIYKSLSIAKLAKRTVAGPQ